MNMQNMSSYALPFAAWELRLYLDTHPDDERALAAYKQLCAAQGGCTYACNTPDGHAGGNHAGGHNGATGTCRACNGSTLTVATSQPQPCKGGRWRWIDGPWPWELEANMTGGKC